VIPSAAAPTNHLHRHSLYYALRNHIIDFLVSKTLTT
jgi:hypothetical protein